MAARGRHRDSGAARAFRRRDRASRRGGRVGRPAVAARRWAPVSSGTGGAAGRARRPRASRPRRGSGARAATRAHLVLTTSSGSLRPRERRALGGRREHVQIRCCARAPRRSSGDRDALRAGARDRRLGPAERARVGDVRAPSTRALVSRLEMRTYPALARATRAPRSRSGQARERGTALGSLALTVRALVRDARQPRVAARPVAPSRRTRRCSASFNAGVRAAPALEIAPRLLRVRLVVARLRHGDRRSSTSRRSAPSQARPERTRA